MCQYSIEERVNYYLGNLINYDKDNPFIIKNSDIMEDIKKTKNLLLYENKRIKKMNVSQWIDKGHNDSFKKQNPFFCNYLEHFDINEKMIVWFVDKQYKYNNMSVLSKARKINDKKYSILFPFRVDIHYYIPKTQLKYDIEYSQKLDKIVWRGALTGIKNKDDMNKISCQRYNIVSKYENKYPNIYVGFAYCFETEHMFLCKQTPFDMKCVIYIPQKDQLKYKFILSIEGNDVATNLKWILASNSVSICTPLKWESWFMESKLKPWVHYIPTTENAEDLVEVYEWALKNEDKCREIVKNANNYMKNFDNEDTETEIIGKVLKEYVNRVKIVDE